VEDCSFTRDCHGQTRAGFEACWKKANIQELWGGKGIFAGEESDQKGKRPYTMSESRNGGSGIKLCQRLCLVRGKRVPPINRDHTGKGLCLDIPG